jgi:hypothetical protein
MCTLIAGVDVVRPGSVLLAANRDEDPGRPSDPPGVLSERPRLIGGRDRLAGGTWLAVREARAVVAILNRRDRSGQPAPPVPGRRSRGALVLEVASAPETQGAEPSLATGALSRAAALARPGTFAPCTLVFASPGASWLMAIDAEGEPRVRPIGPGWHVLTHADLDDPAEPRTAWLLGQLAGYQPGSRAEAEQRLEALLCVHGDDARGIPAVCLHQGRMTTVSSSSIWLTPGEARYRHAEGRPCERPFADFSHLLGTANLGSRFADRPG